MDIKMSISNEGKIRITSGPAKTRLEDVNKFLGRNPDAILVKLEDKYDQSMIYKPGHLCRIEEDEDQYSVFVGKHYIGRLPNEAISYAESVESEPDCLVSMVGKVNQDAIYIYVAE